MRHKQNQRTSKETEGVSDHEHWSRRWIESFAAHARLRYETRALVRATLPGADVVALSYIYALPDGGLVLTIDEANTGAAQATADLTQPHDNQADEHQPHHPPDANEETTDIVHDALWDIQRGTGQKEICISSPEQVVFQVERAAEGELSTGFGWL